MTEPVAEQEDIQFPSCYRHPDVEMAVRCTRCEKPICPDCMIDADVGFHCPECARKGAKESPTTKAPWRQPQGVMSTMPVTITLIGINVIVFFLTQADLDRAIVLFGLQPAFTVSDGLGEWWRAGTSMFLHGTITHVAFNMFALFIFGRILEPLFGRWWYLAFYIASGIVGSAAYVLIQPVFGPAAIGASGAVFGLFGAMLALSIRRRGTPEGKFLFRQLIGLLIINLILTFVWSGIAWQAHVGGFVAGLAIGWVFDMSEDWRMRIAVLGAALLVTAAVLFTKPVQVDPAQLDERKKSQLGEAPQPLNGLGVDARADLRERGLEIGAFD